MESSASSSQVSQESQLAVIEILKKMPTGVDPFEHLKTLKRNLLENKLEDALIKEIFKTKREINLVKFYKGLGKPIPRPLTNTTIVKCHGGKKGSKSVPSSPMKSSLDFQQSNNPPPADAIPSTSKNNNSKIIEPHLLEQLPKVETAFVHLNAAIQFANGLLSAQQNKRIKKGFQLEEPCVRYPEPLLLIRSLCKSIGELLEYTSFDLVEKYRKMIIEASSRVSQIFELFSQLPEFRGVTFQETGIDFLIEKCIKSLFDQKCAQSAMVSMNRGNLVHAVFQGMNSVPIRYVMLEKLFCAFKKLLLRLKTSLDPTAESNIISFADITGSFRLLQLIEFVLVTTSKEPWLDEWVLKSLEVMEDKIQQSIPFAHVLLFVSRQVNNARRFVKIPQEESTMDTS